jgi:HEAT repeat protein
LLRRCIAIAGAVVLQFAAWNSIVTTRAAQPVEPATVEALIADLQSDDPDRTVQSAQALARLGEGAAAAVPALIAALEDHRPITWPPGTPVGPPQIPDHVSNALAAIGNAAVEPLLQVLDRAVGGDAQANSELAIIVLRTLRNLGSKATPALPRIERLIADTGPWRTRFWAIDAYAEIQPTGPDFVAFATRLLGDDEPQIRSRAAQLLGQAGPEAASAVEPLTQLLADGALVWVAVTPDMMHESPVRCDAVEALGRTGPAAKNATGRLRKILADKDDLDCQIPAAVALVRIDGADSVAMDFLIAALSDDEVVGSAIESLAEIGPPAIAALDALSACARHEDSMVQWWAIDALAAVGGKLAVPEIAAVAADTKVDDTVRGVAIEALERIGGHAAIAAIEAVLNDKDEWVRYNAEHALARLRGEPIEE